jgi:hypothetical protein
MIGKLAMVVFHRNTSWLKLYNLLAYTNKSVVNAPLHSNPPLEPFENQGINLKGLLHVISKGQCVSSMLFIRWPNLLKFGLWSLMLKDKVVWLIFLKTYQTLWQWSILSPPTFPHQSLCHDVRFNFKKLGMSLAKYNSKKIITMFEYLYLWCDE